MSNNRTKVDNLAQVFKALAHPVRLAIFDAVRRNCCLAEGTSGEVGGFHVGDIYDEVDVAPSTVSHHLKELKHAGLIVECKTGTFVCLTLGHEAVGELLQFADVDHAPRSCAGTTAGKEEEMSCCPPTPASLPEDRTIPLSSQLPVRIRRAVPGDRARVEEVLHQADLPLGGLDDATLLVAEETGSRRLAGVVGFEVWGRAALLRSLAVVPARRGSGLGKRLVAAVEEAAGGFGLPSLSLLTTTASPFFASLGYRQVPRAEAPRALAASREWDENVCPASAAYLVKDLGASPGEDVRDLVRRSYAAVATSGSGCCVGSSVEHGYDPAALEQVPAESDLGLGCGAPLDLSAVKPGETVLDLGSGGGLDALLAARSVGVTGRVIGIDMTPEMLERARRAADRAGASQVEFRAGHIEQLPVADASVDLVISNCVINLSPDKPAVFREAYRVLRPGGRMVASDIVTEGELPESIRKDPGLYCACVGGATRRDLYLEAIRSAGFARVEVLKEVPFAEYGGIGARSITYRATKA